MAEPTKFDPDQINVGEMYLQRTTFRLPVPPEGEVSSWGPFEFPNIDLPPNRLISSQVDIHVHADDPGLVTATIAFGLTPQHYIEYLEQKAAEQRAAVFESLGSEEQE